MPITFSYRTAAAVAAAAAVVGAQALACPARTVPGPRTGGDVTGPGVTAAAGPEVTAAAGPEVTVVGYWTRARMTAALRAADGRPAGQPAGETRPATENVRQLVRKAPAASPPPWLSGNTAGQGLNWTRRGAVAATAGKVFFTLGGQDYVCSGALVGGKHPDVVLTAAHCVTSGPGQAAAGRAAAGRAATGRASAGPASTGKPSAGQPGTAPGAAPQWATNWMFVPGFRDGLMPYGEYTARRFFVTPGWTGPAGGNEQYDVAFVQVTAATRSGATRAGQPPPGLPVQFERGQDTAPARAAYVFGYPSEQPYTGLYLGYCAGPVTASGGSVRTPCAMTAGDSGGPWLAGFSPRPGSGRVVAVSTYKVSGDLRVLYGAVLGPRARALYQRAVRPAG